MSLIQLDVPCIWNGKLTGFLLKNDKSAAGKTTKIVCVHGWLDNLNSMLPLAQKLIERHPNYEIYLYDRSGHGFSSHIPKGFDYTIVQNVQDLRTVIQTLGWDKEKVIIIGHSYGAILGMIYAATYPKEVLSVVMIDAVPRRETTADKLFNMYGRRIDASLKFHAIPPRTFEAELTFDKALELTKATRDGITDEAAKLLTERSVRRDHENKLHFTRDEALKLATLPPNTEHAILAAVKSIKSFVVFIGTTNPQWPRDTKCLEFFQEYHPTFEATYIDGPHHLHMTHVDEVAAHIEEYFAKYLLDSAVKLNSQL